MIGKDGNLFADIPLASVTERFETLLETSSCRLERIISLGHVTPDHEWYDQAWAEWVVLLQGQAALYFDGEAQERMLKPGDYLWIPAHCRHRVVWTSQQPPTIWLALHINFANEPP